MATSLLLEEESPMLAEEEEEEELLHFPTTGGQERVIESIKHNLPLTPMMRATLTDGLRKKGVYVTSLTKNSQLYRKYNAMAKKYGENWLAETLETSTPQTHTVRTLRTRKIRREVTPPPRRKNLNEINAILEEEQPTPQTYIKPLSLDPQTTPIHTPSPHPYTAQFLKRSDLTPIIADDVETKKVMDFLDGFSSPASIKRMKRSSLLYSTTYEKSPGFSPNLSKVQGVSETSFNSPPQPQSHRVIVEKRDIPKERVIEERHNQKFNVPNKELRIPTSPEADQSTILFPDDTPTLERAASQTHLSLIHISEPTRPY